MGSTIDILREIENELSNENETFNFEKFQDLKMELNEKVNSIVGVFRKYEGLATQADEEMKQAKQRKTYYENQTKKLKGLLQFILERSGKDKIETGKVRLGTRRSSSIEIVDDGLLPKEFVKKSVEVKNINPMIAQEIQKMVDGFDVDIIFDEKIDKIGLKRFASELNSEDHHQYGFAINESKNIQIK